MHRVFFFSKVALVAVGMVHATALLGVVAFAQIKDTEHHDAPRAEKSAAETLHKSSKQKGPKRD